MKRKKKVTAKLGILIDSVLLVVAAVISTLFIAFSFRSLFPLVVGRKVNVVSTDCSFVTTLTYSLLSISAEKMTYLCTGTVVDDDNIKDSFSVESYTRISVNDTLYKYGNTYMHITPTIKIMSVLALVLGVVVFTATATRLYLALKYTDIAVHETKIRNSS